MGEALGGARGREIGRVNARPSGARLNAVAKRLGPWQEAGGDHLRRTTTSTMSGP